MKVYVFKENSHGSSQLMINKIGFINYDVIAIGDGEVFAHDPIGPIREVYQKYERIFREVQPLEKEEPEVFYLWQAIKKAMEGE